jgi:tetratricopeptide (TPR) repeat protein
LLILDGTEEAEDLRKVLNVRGGCGVLVTSRARRDALAKRQDVEPLEAKDAVGLLRRWGGDLAADDHAAARICRLTGYLPLAVKLAGRFLDETGETAAEYVEWLEETPLEALNHGDRRTESVDVLLEKSLEQVSDDACRVLGVVRLLALAPFDRAPIAAALDWSPHQLHKPLGELVSYGLLAHEGDRYEVSHALVHTYARERVEPEVEGVVRLAEHYTVLAERESEGGLEGYRHLDVERRHIMRVLRTCAEMRKWESTHSLVWAVDDYLDTCGYWIERVQALKHGVEATQVLEDQRDVGAFLDNLGSAYRHLGQVKEAIEYHEQALAIFRKAARRFGQLEQESSKSQLQTLSGKESEIVFSGVLTDCLQLDEGIALSNLGLAYRYLGDMKKAIDYHQQSLTIDREIGYRHGEGKQLGSLGQAYYHLGDIDRAIDLYKKSLSIARELRNRQMEGTALNNLGGAYHDLGQMEKSIDYYKQALTIDRHSGDRQGEGINLGKLGSAYSDLGETEKAINYYEKALTIAREIGDRCSEGAWLGDLGLAYSHLGDKRTAIDYYEKALTIAREIGDRCNEGIWLGDIGLTYDFLGNAEKAIDHYKEALTIAREIGDRRSQGIWLVNLGSAYSDLGQEEKARNYLEQSLAIFEQIKSPNADLARGWLAELEGGEKQ